MQSASTLFTTFKKLGVVTPEEVPASMASMLVDQGYVAADAGKSPRMLFAELSVLANTSGSEAEFQARLEEVAVIMTAAEEEPTSPSQDGCLIKEGVCIP